MSDSNSNNFGEILLARWFDRFIAWLIDFVIISTITSLVFTSIFGTFVFNWDENRFFSEGTNYIPVSFVFFVYWIVLDYKKGQSIGKKILHLKVTNIDGKQPKISGILLSSFGKSFLLPIDLILGVIFTNQKRQRIFNKIGNTIVIKIKDDETEIQKIKYTKD